MTPTPPSLSSRHICTFLSAQVVTPAASTGTVTPLGCVTARAGLLCADVSARHAQAKTAGTRPRKACARQAIEAALGRKRNVIVDAPRVTVVRHLGRGSVSGLFTTEGTRARERKGQSFEQSWPSQACC